MAAATKTCPDCGQTVERSKAETKYVGRAQVPQPFWFVDYYCGRRVEGAPGMRKVTVCAAGIKVGVPS